MDVVYQLVFVLHIYQLMKLCRTYFDLDHIEEEKQDKKVEEQELRKDRYRLLKLLAYTAFVSLLWPVLPDVLGSDPGLLHFFLLTEIESPSYLLVSFNVFALSMFVFIGWSIVWVVKLMYNTFSR